MRQAGTAGYIDQRDHCRSAAISIWTTLIVAVLLLLSRRAAGALVDPLPLLASVLLVCGVMSASLGAFVLALRSELRLPSLVPLHAITVFPPILFLVAIWPANFALFAAVLTVTFVTTSAAVLLSDMLVDTSAKIASPSPPIEAEPPEELDSKTSESASSVEERLLQNLADAESSVDGDSSLEASDEEFVTDWTRRILADDGRCLLKGATTVVFAAGQKTAAIHVPFVPLFTACPEVQLETNESIRVRTTAVQPYGMRIEARLAEPASEPLEFLMEFSAVAANSEADAA